MRNACFGPLIQRFRIHKAHEPADTPSSRSIPRQYRMGSHPAYAEGRIAGKRPINFPHQNKIQGRLAFGRIQAGTGYSPRCALPDNAELCMLRADHASPAGDAYRFPQASAKKSRSTASCPILACNSRGALFLLPSSGLISPAKIPLAEFLSLFPHPGICG